MIERLRPLEWVAITFLVWVFARAGLAPLEDLSWLFSVRTVKIFEGLALVGAFVLLARVRASHWPEDRGRTQKIWRALALVPAMPLLFAIAVVLAGIAKNEAAKTFATRLAIAVEQGVDALAVGVPLFALWAAIGLELRHAEGFSSRRLISDGLVALGRLLRELLPLAVVISGYGWMPFMHAPAEGFDATMAAIDRVLFFGHDPVELFERVISQPLSEWMAFSYSFYAFLFPLAAGGLWLKGERPLRQLTFGLAFLLVGSYVSYSLVPVQGPMFTKAFSVPLDLYWLGNMKEALMDRTRVTWDCFPSTHTAATLLIAWLLHKHRRTLFWAVSPMVVTIPFACVYLRYHYAIDVLAGIAWFAIVAAVVERLQPEREPGAEDQVVPVVAGQRQGGADVDAHRVDAKP